MNKDVERIKRMMNNDGFDAIEFEEILSHYQDKPALVPYKLPKGSKIIRSSTNEANRFHENVSRLNYPPIEYARTDRASRKGKPMFYGSIFTSAYKNNALPRIFSALETTDILRDFEKTGKVFTTQSLWLPSRDLQLFAFPFSKTYKKPCKELKEQRLIWKTKLRKFWPEDYCQFAEYVGVLMAETNHSCLYEITSRSIEHILYRSTVSDTLDGVIYPSVWGDGQGMNICLKKETVDECIHFQAASVQCIDKHVGQSNIFGVAESVLQSNGKLRWIPTELALHILDDAYGIDELIKKGTIIVEK